MRDPQGALPIVNGFPIVERTYSPDSNLVSIGLANIHAAVPGIEENKEKIERAVRTFRELGVNIAIFPEFSLSGYFWEDEPACRAYMDQAVTENHLDWLNEALLTQCKDELRGLVLNNLTAGQSGRYRNKTILVSPRIEDPLANEACYDKVFLPGIEKTYTETGGDRRLVMTTANGATKVGFTTCYDYLFVELLRRYAFEDDVDAIIQVASWRGVSSREYPYMNVRTDLYYGNLWDVSIAASSAQNQVWTIACNAVGRHPITGAAFWGGSGIWAPSGVKLVQGSNFREELIVVHNLDIRGARQYELADFDYEFDFRSVYQSVGAEGVDQEDID